MAEQKRDQLGQFSDGKTRLTSKGEPHPAGSFFRPSFGKYTSGEEIEGPLSKHPEAWGRTTKPNKPAKDSSGLTGRDARDARTAHDEQKRDQIGQFGSGGGGGGGKKFGDLTSAQQSSIKEMVANRDTDSFQGSANDLHKATPDQIHDLLQDLRQNDANDSLPPGLAGRQARDARTSRFGLDEQKRDDDGKFGSGGGSGGLQNEAEKFKRMAEMAERNAEQASMSNEPWAKGNFRHYQDQASRFWGKHYDAGGSSQDGLPPGLTGQAARDARMKRKY